MATASLTLPTVTEISDGNEDLNDVMQNDEDDDERNVMEDDSVYLSAQQWSEVVLLKDRCDEQKAHYDQVQYELAREKEAHLTTQETLLKERKEYEWSLKEERTSYQQLVRDYAEASKRAMDCDIQIANLKKELEVVQEENDQRANAIQLLQSSVDVEKQLTCALRQRVMNQNTEEKDDEKQGNRHPQVLLSAITLERDVLRHKITRVETELQAAVKENLLLGRVNAEQNNKINTIQQQMQEVEQFTLRNRQQYHVDRAEALEQVVNQEEIALQQLELVVSQENFRATIDKVRRAYKSNMMGIFIIFFFVSFSSIFFI